MNNNKKFRIWCNPAKCFVELLPLNLIHHIREEGFNAIFQDEDYIFSQALDMKDKDGNEIYEGDILGSSYSDGSGFSVLLCENIRSECLPDRDKIIGNIFETPELLRPRF